MLFRKLESVGPADHAGFAEMNDVEDDRAERRSVILEYLPLALRLMQELAEWFKTETWHSIEGASRRGQR